MHGVPFRVDPAAGRWDLSADDTAGAADPVAAMAAAIHHAPPVTFVSPRDGVRATRRWIHGAVHHHLPPMREHVVTAFYGGSRPLSWRRGSVRVAARTGPGRVNIIPGGHDGRWDMDGSVEVSHVYLPDTRLQACAEPIAGGQRVELVDRAGFADPTASRIQELLCHEAARDDASASLFVEQAIDLLCAHLVRAHSTIGALAAPGPRRGLSEKQVQRVTDYMRAHLEDEIGLATLADLVGLSRYHFCTAFRLATGQTPYDWLTRERMQEARRLLAETSESITGIALTVGYGTPSAFAASFRKAFSVSPSAYRRAL